jgi:probable phosphoglycerate mutase
MKLFLIRHGQTDWNVEGKIQGSCDIELNNTGIKQAEELSNKLLQDKYKFSKIYSSPQRRAVKTAEILSKATKVEYVSIEGLEEINLGQWEGLSWAEVKEKFAAEYEEWYINRRHTKPPKGESYQDMLQRVLASIYKIIKENRDDVVIVTHSAVIMCIQCYLTNTPFDEMTKFKTDNTSITEIDSDLLRKYYMNEEIQDYVEKYSKEVQNLFYEIRELIFKSVPYKIEEKLWAKLPSFYVEEKFIRIIPFKDHINIEAGAIMEHKHQLEQFKITPKGMLQIYINKSIPSNVLTTIFKETLN